MSLVSVKDFGIALGISGGTIRSKISRNQLCCNRKRLIDTEHPLNYKYLLEVNGGDQSVFEQYCLNPKNKANVNKKNVPIVKKETKVSIKKENVSNVQQKDVVLENEVLEKPSKTKASVKVVPVVETKKESAEERRILREQKLQREALLSFEIRKKEAELKVIERNAELKQIELEKKAGNTLPLDLVKKIEVINFQTLLNTLLTETKNMATVMVEKFGGTRSDVVEIESKLNQIYKRTVDTTKKNVDKEIENAVLEYSEVRSRGERK